MKVWGALLLLIGGLMLAISPVYDWLTELTGDSPWIQVVVGIIMVLVALAMFMKKGGGGEPKPEAPQEQPPPTQ